MKQHINITIDSELMEKVRKTDINVSEVCETALNAVINPTTEKKALEEENLSKFIEFGYNLDEIKWLKDTLYKDSMDMWPIFKIKFKRGGLQELENFARKRMELLKEFPDERLAMPIEPTLYSKEK